MTDVVFMKPQIRMITVFRAFSKHILSLTSVLFLFVYYQAVRDWKAVFVMLFDENPSCVCAVFPK